MGTDVDIRGELQLHPPLTEAQAEWLLAFSQTRRMQRDAVKAAALPDPVREAAGLPIGAEGEFYVGGTLDDTDPSVTHPNHPPADQPSLWCQWVPTEERDGLAWDEQEKFIHFEEWLTWLIDHVFTPWGVAVLGEVKFLVEFGEGGGGILRVKDNVVEVDWLEDIDELFGEFGGEEEEGWEDE